MFLMLSRTKQKCKSRHGLGTPLTRDNLQGIPFGHYNDQTYFAQDENFERVPLGLRTSRMSGQAMADDWDAQWKRVSRGTVSGGCK
jgi:hypothetical protein